MFLDVLKPTIVNAQFKLGTNGYLGIQDTFVTHKKKFYANALGMHAPGHVEYELDGSYYTFEADVAINDIAEGESGNPVNFAVYADDRLVAYIPRVRAHEVSRSIIANIYGAKKLTLTTDVLYDSYNNWCQSVWLLPQIHNEKTEKKYSVTGDVEILFGENHYKNHRCIFTMCHSDDIAQLSRMLKSLTENNDLTDIDVVVFAFGGINKFEKIKENYKVIIVQCNVDESSPIYSSTIAALSVHNIVDADEYLYIASNMLVLDNVMDIFSGLQILDKEKILVCTNPNTNIVGCSLKDVVSCERSIYHGQGFDHEFLRMNDCQMYNQLIISSNIMCMNKKALLALEQMIVDMMPHCLKWKNANPKVAEVREQAIINIAMAKINMGAELSPIYNCQLSDNTFTNVNLVDGVLKNNNNEKIKIIEANDITLDKYSVLIKE